MQVLVMGNAEETQYNFMFMNELLGTKFCARCFYCCLSRYKYYAPLNGRRFLLFFYSIIHLAIV